MRTKTGWLIGAAFAAGTIVSGVLGQRGAEVAPSHAAVPGGGLDQIIQTRGLSPDEAEAALKAAPGQLKVAVQISTRRPAQRWPTARFVELIERLHAERGGLAIDYRAATPEELVPEGLTFDVVLNMEVIEHVADRAAFLAACCDLLADDGLMVIATINRTAKAFALAIVGAEYILRWLPIGTHDWRKFLRPSELAAGLRPHDVEFGEITGVGYNPLTDEWSLTRDLDVNYMVVAKRAT